LRRIVVIAVALTALVGATVAYAGFTTAGGSIGFKTTKGGTKKKPVPMSYTLNITAAGKNGNRTPVVLTVHTKMYGIVANGKGFPTCSATKIIAAHGNGDTVCPKGAEVATGYITALLGPASDFTAAGTKCDPALDVWNGGQGKLVYFFVTKVPNHVCGGLKTGSTPPYVGTYKVSGGYLVSNVPIPTDVDYPVAGIAGSLTSEHLLFKAQSKKVKGKTVYSQASVGCKGSKRPWTLSVTTTLPPNGPAKETDTVAGSAACKG
jgi:hypothetical protein